MKRGGVRRLRTKRGFTEADQENLAKQTAAAARGRNAGRGGLGRGGGESGAGELKAKEYAGTKVKFDADGDAPPPPAKRGKAGADGEEWLCGGQDRAALEARNGGPRCA